MWALFLSIMGLIALIGVYICYMYYVVGILKIYVYLLLGLFAVIAYLTNKWSAHYHLHIHHYFFGSVCAIFCCYQSGFVTAVQAIACGVTMEGSARWGISSIWDPNDQPCPEDEDDVVVEIAQSKARYHNYLATVQKEKADDAMLSQNLLSTPQPHLIQPNVNYSY